MNADNLHCVSSDEEYEGTIWCWLYLRVVEIQANWGLESEFHCKYVQGPQIIIICVMKEDSRPTTGLLIYEMLNDKLVPDDLLAERDTTFCFEDKCGIINPDCCGLKLVQILKQQVLYQICVNNCKIVLAFTSRIG